MKYDQSDGPITLEPDNIRVPVRFVPGVPPTSGKEITDARVPAFFPWGNLSSPVEISAEEAKAKAKKREKNEEKRQCKAWNTKVYMSNLDRLAALAGPNILKTDNTMLCPFYRHRT